MCLLYHLLIQELHLCYVFYLMIVVSGVMFPSQYTLVPTLIGRPASPHQLDCIHVKYTTHYQDGIHCLIFTLPWPMASDRAVCAKYDNNGSGPYHYFQESGTWTPAGGNRLVTI